MTVGDAIGLSLAHFWLQIAGQFIKYAVSLFEHLPLITRGSRVAKKEQEVDIPFQSNAKGLLSQGTIKFPVGLAVGLAVGHARLQIAGQFTKYVVSLFEHLLLRAKGFSEVKAEQEVSLPFQHYGEDLLSQIGTPFVVGLIVGIGVGGGALHSCTQKPGQFSAMSGFLLHFCFCC